MPSRRLPWTTWLQRFFIAAFAALLMAFPVSAVPIDFVDLFDGSRGLSQWEGLAGSPIPDYLGSIDAFSLATDGTRSVATLFSHLPPHATRGIWSVTMFDSVDVDVSATFSPRSGIDGMFNLWLLGDRGPGYSFKGGIFGANSPWPKSPSRWSAWRYTAAMGDGVLKI